MATNLQTGLNHIGTLAGSEDRAVDVLCSNKPKKLQVLLQEASPLGRVNFHSTARGCESCSGAEEIARITWS